jgi:predicted histone-like DNA-binding protein
MIFKLDLKMAPGQNNEPAKWYAVPVTAEKVSTEEVAVEISERTTVSPPDTEAVLEALAVVMPKRLLRGEPVHLRGVGTFRIGLHSAGVENPNDFNRSCIRGNHIIYTPDIRILNTLKTMHYEDSGIRGGESIEINWLEDMLSGTANEMLTPGGTVRLSGHKMRIEGDDPAVGLYLMHAETQTQTHVPMNAIPANKPKEIIFSVPADMETGHWQVRIVTQYSGTTGRFSKSVHIFTYEPLLTIG